VRNRVAGIWGVLFLLQGIAEWLDLGALWKIPLGVATFACVILMVADSQKRSESHVTLNLHDLPADKPVSP
jgi:hypothetical protein